jgi:hypothetical protein
MSIEMNMPLLKELGTVIIFTCNYKDVAPPELAAS